MQVGTIEGEVTTSTFKFRAVEEVRKFDFISVKSNDQWILAQVDEVTKKPDGETIATANIIGYRDKGLTKAPRRVIEPDSIVYQADQELISDTLGLEDEGLRIGSLETNPEIDIHVNAEDFYKHFAVLAQTGAGKCVAPETSILMSDGSIKAIKEIFHSSDDTIKRGEEEELRILSNCSVKAVDDESSITDADALYAYRKKTDKILEVKTSSGRKIKVTPEHPLMVDEEDGAFIQSEQIDIGQHIAVPREIDSKSDTGSALLSDSLGKTTENSRERNVLLPNSEEKLGNSGMQETASQNPKGTRSSSALRSAMRSSTGRKKEVLRALFDRKGRLESNEVAICPISEEKANRVSYMLLEFGILSRIEPCPAEDCYRLSIKGVNQIQKFSSKIGFGSSQEKLENYLECRSISQSENSELYWDKVVSIEEKDHEGYVYDITVREHHNFIAGRGGIVSHNSYLTGVLIEEMLEQDFPVLILDPHGEYSSLSKPNPENDDENRSYEVKEFSPNTDINPDALPLQFSSRNFGKKELTTLIPDSLTNSQMGVLYNALKRLQEKDQDYGLNDLMDAVSQEDSTAKWNLLNYLEQLDDSGLFSDDPMSLEDLVEPGRATIINLRAVEPETTEMTAYLLSKKLFDLRKQNKIPPFITILEEAHNFTPEKGFGQTVSNSILRKIASEGRKFGLGLGVISQRPARIDKNVLSQCNTQFILRVTNPNDLKAISKSFEGITSEVESMIKSLPPGVAFALGNEYPVMTDVRTRKSKHGGETQTADTYVEKKDVDVFEPKRSVGEIESKTGEKYSQSYYPLYLVDKEDKKVLVDGVKGQIKAERKKVEGLNKDLLELLREGRDKSEIMERLEIDISKLTSRLEELKEFGLVEEDSNSPTESVLDLGLEEMSVDADNIIEDGIEKSEAIDMVDGDNAEKVYYPYYSHGEVVYDPILDKEI